MTWSADLTLKTAPSSLCSDGLKTVRRHTYSLKYWGFMNSFICDSLHTKANTLLPGEKELKSPAFEFVVDTKDQRVSATQNDAAASVVSNNFFNNNNNLFQLIYASTFIACPADL